MKTNLPTEITTIEQATNFLRDLHNNGEAFHPEDDAHTIEWDLPSDQKPDYIQATQLNKLMADIYNLPGNDGRHSDPLIFDPCDFLNTLSENVPELIDGNYLNWEAYQLADIKPFYGAGKCYNSEDDSLNDPFIGKFSTYPEAYDRVSKEVSKDTFIAIYLRGVCFIPLFIDADILDDNANALWDRLLGDQSFTAEQRLAIQNWYDRTIGDQSDEQIDDIIDENGCVEDEDDRIFGESDMIDFAFRMCKWYRSNAPFNDDQLRAYIENEAHYEEGDESYTTYKMPVRP